MTDRAKLRTESSRIFALACAGLLFSPALLAFEWSGKTDWKEVEYLPGGEVIYLDHLPQSENPEIRAYFAAAAESVDAGHYGAASNELGMAGLQAAGSELAAIHDLMAYFHLKSFFTGDEVVVSNLETSCEVAEKAGDETGRGAALSELGSVHTKLAEDNEDDAEYDSALCCLRQALAINQKAGLLEGVSYDQRLIGLCLEKQGRLDSALSHYETSLAGATSLNDTDNIVSLRTSIGDVFAEKGDTASALKSYLSSWSLLREAGGDVGAELVVIDLKEYLSKMGTKRFSAACKKQGFSQAEVDSLVAELRKTE